jgi:hypothetical protein
MVTEASYFAFSENRQTGTLRICLARLKGFVGRCRAEICSNGANDYHRVESRKANHIFDGDRQKSSPLLR